MLTPIFYAHYYTHLCTERVKETASSAKEIAIDNKREIARTTVIASAVYLASRANGFKAGYEFAKNTPRIAT